jgi:hypothetical protein
VAAPREVARIIFGTPLGKTIDARRGTSAHTRDRLRAPTFALAEVAPNFRNSANVAEHDERRVGLRSVDVAKEQRLVKSWSQHRQQVLVDTIEQAIRDALPIGYTGQMVVKVSVADGRVKVEVEPAE